MSEDPMRWRDALSNVPPELGELVRDLDAPPPLPPEIRLHVRGRLSTAATPTAPAMRWVAPAVVGVAVVVAGLLLWVFRPAPPQPPQQIAQEPDGLGVEAPEADVPSTEPDEQPVAPQVAGGRPVAPAPAQRRVVDSTGTVAVTVLGGLADIYVDGEARGTTPLSAEVSVGNHTIEARFQDGRVARRTVLVAAGSLARIGFDALSSQSRTIPPEPEPPAVHAPVRVPATERSASDLRRVVTENRGSVLRCSERNPTAETVRIDARITVGADGRVSAVGVSGAGSSALHRCVESEILAWRFAPGSEAAALSVPFVLTPSDGTAPIAASPTGTGDLIVNTQPWSRVYIDGRFVGNTPIARIQLPAGPHHIRFEAEGYPSQSSTIQIEADRTMRMVRQLSEGGRSHDEDE